MWWKYFKFQIKIIVAIRMFFIAVVFLNTSRDTSRPYEKGLKALLNTICDCPYNSYHIRGSRILGRTEKEWERNTLLRKKRSSLIAISVKATVWFLVIYSTACWRQHAMNGHRIYRNRFTEYTESFHRIYRNGLSQQ